MIFFFFSFFFSFSQLKQFGRELSTDYYKDEPFELDDGTVIDDVPKDEDEEDEDDGYLN